MYKPNFNKRSVVKFTHFTNHNYSLFSVLGKEVIIGVLSVATLQHATANNSSMDGMKVSVDTTAINKSVQLDEVNVTGTRAPLTVSQQARMVTVLSREEIQAAPVQSVNDLLKYAIGVDVRQKGPLGALTDVGIRGGNSEQITVLLNGINICDAQTAHNAFDFPVDISEIERIEVLEGPAARVYGTSSLLGAINIVTKTPQKTSASARLESGSFGYFNTGLRANIAQGKWNNQLSASYTRSDGYLRSKAGRLNSDYNTIKSFYQGNYNDNQFSVNWHAGISLKNFGSNTFYSVRSDDQFEHTFKAFTAIQAENKEGLIHIRPAIYWNRGMDRFEFFRNAPNKCPFNYHRTDIYGINLNAYFDWIAGRTALGAEIRHEDLVSGNLGEKLEYPLAIHGTNRMYTNGIQRTNTQFFIEHNLILNRFTLSAGLIAVKNSQANMNMRVYPGLDMSYRIGENLKLYASYNTSLRMPSVTELFYSVGGYKADKHLKPEELEAIEMGLKLNNKYICGKVAAYYNHHKNLIDWISDGSRDKEGKIYWKSVNFGMINSSGIETNLDLNFLNIIPSQKFLEKIGLGYVYINQNQEKSAGITSRYVLEYLKHKFVANVSLNIWSNLKLNVSYRLLNRMGEYIDINEVHHKYPVYNVVDSKLSWNGDRWKAYIEANNLFNKTYIDCGNVPQPGIWIVAGVAINL